MMSDTDNQGLNISIKSFIAAITVIFILMIGTYILTFFIPAGEYARIMDKNGNMIIDAATGYHPIDGGLPFWKWILSPLLVLTADGGGMVAAILVFLLVIGGVFNSLQECGLMKYMLDTIVHRFGHARSLLLAVITFFFMAMGAFIGSFEECVPLVPIVVSLAINLGWDAMTGMGMSLLAVGCGFSSGVCNPFTIGVAQSLAGLPMFSGMWLRVIGFVLVYFLLIGFLLLHIRKLPVRSGLSETHSYQHNPQLSKGLYSFAGILGVGILVVLSSGFITVLQDYTMIIVAIMFLAAGITSTLISGIKGRLLLRSFISGIVSILPAVLLILMASSIKYTLTEGHILDTLLYWGVNTARELPKSWIILFIYLIVLVLNFFISSGSAKAFLLIPLIVPMAQLFDIEPQLCIMAFAFGDGFSNVFYPTNAALLISLGLVNISYSKWIRFSWKFQALNLLLTSGMLLFGLFIGYH